MYATLTIVRYPKMFAWAGVLAMALFRLALMKRQPISFYKLLGCGKNGTFSKTPDLRQWGVFCVYHKGADADLLSAAAASKGISDNVELYGAFITKWWALFKCERWTIVLTPLEGHGTWDTKKIFGDLPSSSSHPGMIAVLTRATIRLNKIKRFWQYVDGAAKSMAEAPGFITSLSIGEMPWKKQATFSVWQNKEAMKSFAYKTQVHADIVKQTHNERWYSEDMFVRFAIISSFGSINGKNPLYRNT